MRRIYGDFNDFDASGVLPLVCAGSLQSIACLTEPLTEGEEVWISDGDMMCAARVYKRSDGSWEARSSWRFVDDTYLTGE